MTLGLHNLKGQSSVFEGFYDSSPIIVQCACDARVLKVLLVELGSCSGVEKGYQSVTKGCAVQSRLLA